MNFLKKSVLFFNFFALFFCSQMHAEPMKLCIIIGSVRDTKTGQHIAKNIAKLLTDRSDLKVKMIYLPDYNLPFYTDATVPASRKGAITDPVLKKWSDIITKADGFIMVAPEYNGGYSAALKNALDCLYVEWNHKPVGFVGYSGGSSGASSMIAQLRTVASTLEMVPVETDIKIGSSWKALSEQAELVDLRAIADKLNLMVEELLVVFKAKKSE
jgi:NAD(P)H-dependent FMN reductase